MTVIKTTKKNRRTGTEIALHRERFGGIFSPGSRRKYYYFCECCGHGNATEEYETMKEAIAKMSKPDEWCVGCIEGDPIEVERPHVDNEVGEELDRLRKRVSKLERAIADIKFAVRNI